MCFLGIQSISAVPLSMIIEVSGINNRYFIHVSYYNLRVYKINITAAFFTFRTYSSAWIALEIGKRPCAPSCDCLPSIYFQEVINGI